MADLEVELVAVEERVWSGRATMVVAKTTEGEIGIQVGHEPVLGELALGGTVSIHTVEGEVLVAAVQGGFLSTTATKVTVLAESAQFASDIVIDAARAELAAAAKGSDAEITAQGQVRAYEKQFGASK